MPISLNPSTLLNGQGIDVNSLVQQVLSQGSGQLTEWQSEQTTLQTQAGSLALIKNDLGTLANAMQALSDPLGALTAIAASSSETSVLTGTATTAASAGVHQIEVTNLASAGLVYTNSIAGGAAGSCLPSGASGGEIDLQIGGSGGTTRQIMITAGSNDTLNTLVSYINKQAWGVTASVVTDANGARLAITSQSTGSGGELAVTSNNTSLDFNPPTGGKNASLSIDGIPFSSTSNTITGAIPGVTLSLAGAAPGSPVQLTVGPDVSQATAALNAFVSAYNQVINDINQQFTVNPATDSEGPLGSDSGLRSLQASLMNDVTYSVSGNSGMVNLAALGINMNDDGTLTVGTTPDGKTLNQVMTSNPAAFLNFFQNATSTGFANHFHSDLTNLTDSTIGVLNVDLAQNKIQQRDLADSINNFEAQLTARQQRLTQQFSQVNASLQSYPLLLQQVTAALSTLDTNNSSKS